MTEETERVILNLGILFLGYIGVGLDDPCGSFPTHYISQF